jgi:hypothetical protein
MFNDDISVLSFSSWARMLVDELPSWVYFPDKERAEWLNNIIKQLWPNVNNYVRSIFFHFPSSSYYPS